MEPDKNGKMETRDYLPKAGHVGQLLIHDCTYIVDIILVIKSTVSITPKITQRNNFGYKQLFILENISILDKNVLHRIYHPPFGKVPRMLFSLGFWHQEHFDTGISGNKPYYDRKRSGHSLDTYCQTQRQQIEL